MYGFRHGAVSGQISLPSLIELQKQAAVRSFVRERRSRIKLLHAKYRAPQLQWMMHGVITVRWAFFSVLLLAACTSAAEAASCSTLDKAAAISRLSTGIQFKTVSSSTADNHIPSESVSHFDAFQAWLPTAYPEVWRSLEVQQVRPRSSISDTQAVHVPAANLTHPCACTCQFAAGN
jgi:hypothetical protein